MRMPNAFAIVCYPVCGRGEGDASPRIKHAVEQRPSTFVQRRLMIVGMPAGKRRSCPGRRGSSSSRLLRELRERHPGAGTRRTYGRCRWRGTERGRRPWVCDRATMSALGTLSKYEIPLPLPAPATRAAQKGRASGPHRWSTIERPHLEEPRNSPVASLYVEHEPLLRGVDRRHPGRHTKGIPPIKCV